MVVIIRNLPIISTNHTVRVRPHGCFASHSFVRGRSTPTGQFLAGLRLLHPGFCFSQMSGLFHDGHYTEYGIMFNPADLDRPTSRLSMSNSYPNCVLSPTFFTVPAPKQPHWSSMGPWAPKLPTMTGAK
jgi:hypothetical protein